jgi:ABC-type amino acid transport substrate-binding protein
MMEGCWRAAGVLLLLTLGPAAVAGAGDLADVKARGKLVLECFANQDSGFVRVNLDVLRERQLTLAQLRDPEGFEGLDVELLKGFAKSQGVALEIHSLTTGYDDLIPGLLARRGDVVANSLTITPARQEQVEFSNPYLIAWEVVLVPPDSPVRAAADLKGKTCAVARGASHLGTLRSSAPEARVLEKDFPFEAMVAVNEGQADCTISENAVPPGFVLEPPFPPLKVAFRLKQVDYGMAVRKGSDLLAPLNAYLEGVKQSGELDRLVDRFSIRRVGVPAPLVRP